MVVIVIIHHRCSAGCRRRKDERQGATGSGTGRRCHGEIQYNAGVGFLASLVSYKYR